MSDLRGILGDRYEEVLTKATKRALFNYPNLPISIPEHEALAAQALAAVLPGLLADAWEEGHADGLHDAHEHREHRKLRNPYRPETATRDATDAPVTLAAPDAINPPPNPPAAVTEPHNTEGETHE